VEKIYKLFVKSTTSGAVTVNKEINISVGCFQETSMETVIFDNDTLPVPWVNIEDERLLYRVLRETNPDISVY